MSLPFSSTLYDQIYLNISSELRAQFPQANDEDLVSWHRRLLFEFISYLQSKYEAETVEPTVLANKKNNKKKQQNEEVNTTLFDANVERALDIVTQDSNFAIYLLYWWLPILISAGDYVNLHIELNCSGTPAQHVALKSLALRFQLDCFELTEVNGVRAAAMTKKTFQMSSDAYVNSLFNTLHNLHTHVTTGANKPYTLSSISSGGAVTHFSDPMSGALHIANTMHSIKTILESLFISHISMTSNLIVDALSVNKTTEDRGKGKRKRFNSRKFIDNTTVSSEDMAANVMQSLMLSVFRTYYDFDEATISQDLYDYLFLRKHNLAF